MSAQLPRFQNMNELRAAHNVLLIKRREDGESPSLHEEIASFLTDSQATGSVLDIDEDRWAAQSILDYWGNVLTHANYEHPDPVLTEFNPALAPELDDSLCPYVGLDAFKGVHQDLFFGRDQLIDEMVMRLKTDHLLAVLGPSGSGKSSVVLAGLVPELQEGGIPGSDSWQYLGRMVPGSDPLKSLAFLLTKNSDAAILQGSLSDNSHLSRLLDQSSEHNCLLVIDQFEETFTLCDDEQTRKAFLDNLLHLANHSKHYLILTMRTDFENSLARYEEFYERFQEIAIQIPPLTTEQIRDTIIKPAEKAGLKFEEGLVDELAQEVVGEPAALPLLQFTLLKLWENRVRVWVTWDSYRRLGGGRRSLARSADAFYESLNPEDQATAREILLSIVRPGEGLEITSSRIPRAQLYQSGRPHERIEHVLNRFVKEHLLRLTKGASAAEDQIEVAHEALVRNWPRLVSWLEEERSSIRRRQRLTAAARQWMTLNRDPNALWRGRQLAEAMEQQDLKGLEAEFVQASLDAAEAEERAKEEAYQRQLAQDNAIAAAQAQRAAEETRAARILRVLSALLVVLAVILVASAVYGTQQGAQALVNASLAETAAANAVVAQETASAEKQIADDQTTEALQARATAVAAEEQAVSAQQMAEQASKDAVLAQEEAVKARDNVILLTRLGKARSLAAAAIASININTQSSLRLSLEAIDTTLSVDNQILPEAEAALRQAVRSSQLQLNLAAHNSAIHSVAFSPDSKSFATASEDGTVKVWDATTGDLKLSLIEKNSAIHAVAFDPRGTKLATASSSGITLWNANTGEVIAELDRFRAIPGYTGRLAFNQDGSQLATFTPYANQVGELRVWDVTTQKRQSTIFVPVNYDLQFAFRPDGSRLVSASTITQIWSPSSPGAPVQEIRGHEAGVSALAMSDSGEFVATGGNDGTARLWRASNGDQVLVLDLDSPVLSLDFNPDGSTLAVGTQNGKVFLWDTTRGQVISILNPQIGAISSLAFNATSECLAISSTTGGVQLWMISVGRLIREVSTAFAFHPDGNRVALAQPDAAIRLWDISTNRLLDIFADHTDTVYSIAFSPDGTQMASSGEERVTKVWDVSSGQITFNVFEHEAAIIDVEFSPDSSLLATASLDGTAVLWRARDGREMFELASPARAPLTSVSFNPQPAQQMAATSDEEGQVILWNTSTGAEIRTLRGHSGKVNQVAFNPTGDRLVSVGEDGQALSWDPFSDSEPESILLQPPDAQPQEIIRVAFSPDNRTAAFAMEDRSIVLWDLETNQSLKVLPGYNAAIQQIAFSTDGSRIGILTQDNQIYLEFVAIEDVMRLADQLIIR